MRGLGFAPGDVVAVTGAATGIGRETVLLAARAGLAVAAWARTAAAALPVVEQVRALGGQALPVGADLTVPDEVARAWEATGAWGPPRYFACNASPSSRSGATRSAVPDSAEGLRGSLGAMVQQTERWLEDFPDVAASAVFTASIAGNVTSAGTGADWYAPAKAGLAGYVRLLAASHRGRVRFNAVAPSLIETERTLDWKDGEGSYWEGVARRTPAGRVGRAEEVAACLLFLLSPAAAAVDGALLVIDGGRTIAT